MSDSLSRMRRTLPANPSLEQLKKQAKELLDAFRAREPDAVAEIEAAIRAPIPTTESFALHDAQLALARSYGFASWTKLKAHVEGVTVARLSEAVIAGDLATVRAMIKAAPDLVHVDMAGNNEHRALHYAVLHRKPELVRVLMEAGADARKGIYPHRDATSAYIIAKERGYDDLVAIIDEEEQHRREEMSCPNATVSPVQDELNAAIREGREDVVAKIVDGDPTLVKACDRDGQSPLHVAADVLNQSVVALLLERGADVKRKNAGGQTPLDRAVRAVEWRRKGSLENFPAVAQRLLHRGAELNAIAAVALGDAERVRELYRRDPASVADPKHGLLTVAVNHDRIEMVRLLLDLGLDPNERTQLTELEEPVYSWGGPLWHCAASAKYAIAELLLERKADPNAQVYASGSPVFQAYGARDEKMKALLTRHGGRSDAITAGLYRDTEAGREILRSGDHAGLDDGHFAGKTTAEQMLWGAACGGDPELVALCLAKIDWPREDPRWFGMLDQPLRLWNHGPGHWAKNDLPREPYLDCFRLILERCDANIVGRFGRQMLHEVAACGSTWGKQVMTEAERIAFATMLLDAGAKLDARDDLLKSTPLGWAARWGRAELVDLLLRRGAPTNEPDAEPWATPLAWATKMGREAIVEQLRRHGNCGYFR